MGEPITWHTERRRLGDLREWDKNPRTLSQHDAEHIRRSLDTFGLADPLIVNLDNSLIGGHQRKRLLADPDAMVDVRVPDRQLTEREAEELAIRLNKAQGDWDFDALANGFEIDDLIDWGFTEEELQIGGFDLEGEKPEDPGAQIDKAEELREKWGVESGQLWRLGEHRLICGDCTDRAVVDRVMGGEKAALAWFDPPFGIDLKPQRGLTDSIDNDGREEAQKLWALFLPLMPNYLIDPAHVFLCQGWTEFDWTLPLIRKYFRPKAKIVWNKNVWGIGYFTRPKHEDIIYCWNGEPSKIDEPVADVWDVARKNAPEHAAEKPPELSAIAIEHFSEKSSVVMDWFSGLGGSTIACERLGRKCRAVEISPAYVAVALQRWADMTGQTPELSDT